MYYKPKLFRSLAQCFIEGCKAHPLYSAVCIGIHIHSHIISSPTSHIYTIHVHVLSVNHWGIFPEAGFTDIREYRYYKRETRGLDFEGMIEDLKVCAQAVSTKETVIPAVMCSAAIGRSRIAKVLVGMTAYGECNILVVLCRNASS